MGDHSRSNSHELFHILGFGSICRACKSLLAKCYPDKKSFFFKKTPNKTKPKPIPQDAKITNQTSIKRNSGGEGRTQSPIRPQRISPQRSFSRRSCDDYGTRSHQPAKNRLSRNASLGPSPGATRASLLRTMSHRNSVASSSFRAPSLSRTASTTILYTNSSGLLKPPPTEERLDCTLDDLCFGCVKKISVTIDRVTDDGEIVEEDEVFTIKVKAGWRKGTKITFEGKGNEIPGAEPADLVFVVSETEHPLLRRRDDDLELELDIPLLEALTGPTLSIPLLGGQDMSLTIDEVVTPGYEKIIHGQGMPKQNESGKRGNLIVRFSVKFPEKLTDQQRWDAAEILQRSF